MPRLLRMALVLLLAATLATSAVLAAPPQGAQPRRSATVIPDTTGFVAHLWRFLSRGWIKNGSVIEPDGNPVQTKNGSEMDPNGSHLQALPPATPNKDNGGQVDPNG